MPRRTPGPGAGQDAEKMTSRPTAPGLGVFEHCSGASAEKWNHMALISSQLLATAMPVPRYPSSITQRPVSRLNDSSPSNPRTNPSNDPSA